MLDLLEMATEAVKCRREGSVYFGEYLKELEAAGCSPERVRDLLERAEAELPHPQAPRALRILRRAAKVAAKGDGVRAHSLHELACELVGEDEVTALTEEYRLNFAVQRRSEPSRPKYSFAS